MNHTYDPVIIIGAPRSGTNMLRDLLTQLPGCGTWPCDEINYIWRHGNRSVATDEFTAAQATSQVSRHVRAAFEHLARSRRIQTVIEKTCANCLRIPFVDCILPEAKFVHLVRDGRDAAVSARQRWCARMDWSYVLRKARFVPCTDLPFYATDYLVNRLTRLTSKQKQLRTWGPKHASLVEDLRHGSLLEVCALQWKQCVDAATTALLRIDAQRVLTMRYEDFVTQPAEELARVADFVQVDVVVDDCLRLVDGVRSTSIGQAARVLNMEELSTIETLCEETLKTHRYELFFKSDAPGLHVEGQGGVVRNLESARRRAG